MTKEQEKAIEFLNHIVESQKDLENCKTSSFYKNENNAIKTVLNLIQTQANDIQRMQELLDLSDANNVKKDKIINEMLEEYEYNVRINVKNFCDEEMRRNTCIQDCKNCIKQYFERKVNNEKTDNSIF